jgi:MazG family protein
MEDAERAGKKFKQLIKILDTLRGEGGCPWDKEQDEKSVTNYFLEEAYELVDAVRSRDAAALLEELGDVLMEVVFLARIYKEKSKFSMADVLEGINKKMIRRHPHVFSQKKTVTSKKVRDEWRRQKRKEKAKLSPFDGLAKSLPSLLKAFQIGLRVSDYGFDWNKPLEALQKVKEEILELEIALKAKKEKEIFDEIGDVFFAFANVSRLLRVNPEIALQEANKKFIKRFDLVEKGLKKQGKKLGEVSLKEMDELWEKAKRSAR